MRLRPRPEGTGGMLRSFDYLIRILSDQGIFVVIPVARPDGADDGEDDGGEAHLQPGYSITAPGDPSFPGFKLLDK